MYFKSHCLTLCTCISLLPSFKLLIYNVYFHLLSLSILSFSRPLQSPFLCLSLLLSLLSYTCSSYIHAEWATFDKLLIVHYLHVNFKCKCTQRLISFCFYSNIRRTLMLELLRSFYNILQCHQRKSYK